MRLLALLAPLVFAWQVREQDLAEARRLLAAGEAAAALELIEPVATVARGDARAWRLFAEALAAAAEGSSSGYFMLVDALGAWERVVELELADAAAARAGAELALALGENARALRLATQGLGAALLAGTEPEPRLLGVAAAATTARARERFARSTDEDAGWDQAFAEARDVLASLRRRAPDDADLALVEAGFLADLGLAAPAAEVLRAALERAPDATELFRRLFDLHRAEQVDERLAPWCDDFVARHAASATARFYAGYAELLAGDLALLEERPGDATAAYGRALARFSQAEVLEPAFAEGVRRTSAQASIGIAWAALAAGDLERARALLPGALQAWPDLLDEPDNLGRSLGDAIRVLGDRLVRMSRFREAAELVGAVCRTAPVDGEWWNNLGFLLREYGSQVEGGTLVEPGDPAQRAREINRESWQAYARACELAPNDARIVNDAALMQIYHVRDELERAEALELQAIRVGLEQLAALGPEPDERARFPLAQAVGDAYENLAYLEDHLRGNHDRAREYLALSIATDSGERSQLARWLAELEAGRDVPKPEPRRVPGPDVRLPSPASIAWEGDLGQAGVRSTNDRRPLFVYWRGSGLGLVVPYLDRQLTRPEVAAQLADLVCVVADGARHTFVDRRRDGAPVACPRYGSLTCGEHVAVDAQFVEWWRLVRGQAPGESEEGFYLLPHGVDAPNEALTDLPARPELARLLADARPPPDVDEVVKLARGGGARVAKWLLTTTGRAGRQRAESLLFDPQAPAELRSALVGAVFEVAPHEKTWAELRDVLPTQTRDAGLAALAASAWPAELAQATDGIRPLRRACQWHPDEGVRAAAAARLVELGGNGRWLRALGGGR